MTITTVLGILFVGAGLWLCWTGGKGAGKMGRIHFDRTQVGTMTRGNITEVSPEGVPTISYVRDRETISSFSSPDSFFTSDQVGERVRIWYNAQTGQGPVVLGDDFLYFWTSLLILGGGLLAIGMGTLAIVAA